MENKFMKGLFLAFVVAYVVSPVDLVSGCPIDDLLLIFLTLASQKHRLVE